MNESLLDFGNIAQLAQNQLRNSISMAQLGMQRERQDQAAQQLELNRQQQETAHLNSMREIWQDPRVQNNDTLSDQMFAAMAPSLGIPTDHLVDTLTQSRNDRRKLLTATLSGNEKDATDAMIKLTASLSPDKQAIALKNLESIPVLKAKLQTAQQVMDINAAKYDKMRQDQAIVNEGLGPTTALSAMLRQHTRAIDSPSFQLAQRIFKDTQYRGVLTSKDQTISAKSKADFSFLLDGNGDAMANHLDEELTQYEYQLSTAQNALVDLDHGVKQPGNARQQLTARIATLSPIIGAMREMQDWYRDPLDSDKATRAKLAYQGIEQRRLELESMNKKLDAQRTNLVNLANEKFDYKQNQDAAIAKGQQRLAEMGLTDPVKISKAAAQIAAKIQEEDGILPSVDDIKKAVKDQNAPLVQNNNYAGAKGETAYATKFNQNMADTDTKLYESATKAQDVSDSAGRVLDILTNNKTITGAGADWRLSLAKALKVAGLSDSDAPENTELLFTDLARGVLDQIRSSGLGSGNGFSNTDREYLEKAAGGQIKLEKDALIGIAKRVIAYQKMTVGRWNARVKQLPDSALASGISRDPIQIRPYQSQSPSSQPKEHLQSGATVNSLPQGSKQIGTSNGKPVYQSPDGKKWIGN